MSTTYEASFHPARMSSTLDHLAKGRVGWNMVTSYLDSAARNLLGGEARAGEQLRHEERYAMAEEYVGIVYKLFESSWREDAVVLDWEKGGFRRTKSNTRDQSQREML